MALARWQRTITDNAGNALSGASIEVRRETPGQPLEPLFSDRDGLVPILTNPFNADANGFAAFHCAGGPFQIVATATIGMTVVTQTWRYVGIGLAQETDTNLPAELQGVIDKVADIVSVRDFGATGDGVTDDTDAVQDAIDALAASGGGKLWFPQGYYICSGGIVIDTPECIELQGDGWQSTFIETGPAADVVLISLAGGRHAVRDLGIVGSGAQGTYIPTIAPSAIGGNSHAVHIESSAVDVLVDRCYILGGFDCILNEGADTTLTDCFAAFAYGDAVVFNRGPGLWMRRCKCDQNWPVSLPPPGASFAARANSTAYSVGDVRSVGDYYLQCLTGGVSGISPPTLLPYEQNIIDGTVVWRLASNADGTSLTNDTGGNELHVQQSDFTGCWGRAAVYMDHNFGGDFPRYFVFTDNVVGQSVGTCFDIVHGSNLMLSGNEISGGRAAGTGCMQMRQNFQGEATITNNHIFSGFSGIYLGSGGKVSIIGNSFGGIDDWCIDIDANISRFNVIGNDCSPSPSTGGNGSGIRVATGGSDRYNIAHNIVDGTSPGVQDGGTGINKIVIYNF